jgi:hypothetical protein
MASYNKQDSTSPINPWVGGVLLIVTDHIQGTVRLGLTPNQSMDWWTSIDSDCNVLLCNILECLCTILECTI